MEYLPLGRTAAFALEFAMKELPSVLGHNTLMMKIMTMINETDLSDFGSYGSTCLSHENQTKIVELGWHIYRISSGHESHENILKSHEFHLLEISRHLVVRKFFLCYFNDLKTLFIIFQN